VLTLIVTEHVKKAVLSDAAHTDNEIIDMNIF
jgi:hypothetical protein